MKIAIFDLISCLNSVLKTVSKLFLQIYLNRSPTQMISYIDKFCDDKKPFKIFSGDDFSGCFEELVIICPVYILLVLVSGYYIVISSCRPMRSGRCNVVAVIYLRVFLQAVIVISEVVLLVEQYLAGSSLSVMNIVCISFILLSWFLSAVVCYISRNSWTNLSRGRDRDMLIIVWALAFISSTFELHSAILTSLGEGSAFDNEGLRKYDAVNVYIRWCLYLGVLLSQIPRSHIPDVERANVINDAEAGSSRSVSFTEQLSEHSFPIYSRVVFHWVGKLFADARLTQFPSVDDLTFDLPPSMNPIATHTKLKLALSEYQGPSFPELKLQDDAEGHVEDIMAPLLGTCETPTKKPDKFCLIKGLNKAFGWSFWPLNLIKLVSAILELSIPIVLNLFLRELESQSFDIKTAGVYLAVMLLITVVSTFVDTHLDYEVNKLEISMKGSLIVELYAKVLNVNVATLKNFSVGEITNFASQDADQMTDHIICFFEVWYLPLKLGVSFYLLYHYIGISFLSGLGFCILLIPVNQFLTAKISSSYDKLMEFRDVRLKIVHEIINNIKSIKMFSWEEKFEERVNKMRAAEIKRIRTIAYLDALCVYFWASAPPIITFLIVLTYSLLGNNVSVSIIFTTLALVQQVIVPMNALPWVIMGFVYAWTSVKRITKFLNSPDNSPQRLPVSKPTEVQNTIELENASFYWDNPENCCLVGLNFQVNKGELLVVMGRTGSGKSSLLLALSQELNLKSGYLRLKEWRDGTGLVLQDPWIKSGTIKDNITDGSPFDLYWYEHVITACALDKDIKTLPNGDSTYVGTDGGALSGGQKIRLSLARAVYKNKHVYLIDDIFSSLDGNVATHIFEHCINGILANKTRVICTHHTKFSSTADTLMLLEKGQISYIGLPQTSLIPQTSGLVDRQASKDEVKDKEEAKVDENKLPSYEEERCFGSVDVMVYKHYCKAAGWCLTITVLIALIGMQASDTLSNWWLSVWVKSQSVAPQLHAFIYHFLGSNLMLHSTGLQYYPENTQNVFNPPMFNLTAPTKSLDSNTTFYLEVYCAFIGANTVFTLIRAFGYATFGLAATSTLHKNMLTSVMQASLHFFDNTPIGVILNRFSRDIYQCDIDLPFFFNNLLAEFFLILGGIVMTCYGLPYVLLTMIPMLVVYYFLCKYYRNAVREIKRLYSISQSPLFSHFEQTITGVQYIHAARQSDSTHSKGIKLLKNYQKTDFCLTISSCWLELRLQLLAASVLAIAAGVILLEIHFSTINVALMALALTYGLSINKELVNLVQTLTELEKQFIGAERVLQYTFELPIEFEPEDIQPVDITWPIAGTIEFVGVSARYHNASSKALDDVSFKIGSGEKVGIVGRTGAGKSTIFLALFRLCPIESGCILIDNVNTNEISGKVLRKKLSIIPQSPLIIEGTIRENLDPFMTVNDEVMMRYLERCQLTSIVEERGGLGGKISTGNLSVGERQLFSLARALLHKSKILCLDEATSGIDMETDKLIQQIIREEFSSATILTVAHRLETVMDYDRILVVSNGKIVEDNAPHMLLENNKSLFYKLALAAGIVPHNSKLAASNFNYHDSEASSSSYS